MANHNNNTTTATTNTTTITEDPSSWLDAVIVGAGAAGLTASYDLLQHAGIDNIRILEATSDMGGRMRVWKSDKDHPLYTTGRPLNLGAEWVHGDTAHLQRIVADNHHKNNKLSEFEHDLQRYQPDYQWWWQSDQEWGVEDYGPIDFHFQHYTWYDFFDQVIRTSRKTMPIEFNCIVTEIDYSHADRVQLHCQDGRTFATRACIVTVALSVMNDITWTPALPPNKQDALDKVAYNAGLKAFLSFSENFYASVGDAFDLLYDGRELEFEDAHFYYDASYDSDNQDGDHAVLGVFMNGYYGEPFRDEKDETVILDAILARLDNVFDGQASQYFVTGHVLNWSVEPFFRGTYSDHGRSQTYGLISTLAAPVDQRVFFAGEGLMEYHGYVHTAAFSGRNAARALAKALPSTSNITPPSSSSSSSSHLVGSLQHLVLLSSILLLRLFW